MDHDPRCSTQRDLTVPTPCARRLRAEAARRWLGPPDLPVLAQWTDRLTTITPADESTSIPSWLTADGPT